MPWRCEAFSLAQAQLQREAWQPVVPAQPGLGLESAQQQAGAEQLRGLLEQGLQVLTVALVPRRGAALLLRYLLPWMLHRLAA